MYGSNSENFFGLAIPAEVEVELVKVEVDVVGEAEAGHDAQREEGDGHPPLRQPARPADQARVAAAELDQLGVLYGEQWSLQCRIQQCIMSFYKIVES